MIKYSAKRQSDVEYLTKTLRTAINLCEYDKEYDISTYSDDVMISAYRLSINNDVVHLIFLMKDEADNLCICIGNNYYETMYLIKDIEASVLAYILRNTTKVLDDPDVSGKFFAKFFKQHDFMCDKDMIRSIISAAVEEYCNLSIVYAKTEDKHIAQA